VQHAVLPQSSGFSLRPEQATATFIRQQAFA
jgi:hypothetical protein